MEVKEGRVYGGAELRREGMRGWRLAAVLVVAACASGARQPAREPGPRSMDQPMQSAGPVGAYPDADSQAALHLLNRLTFGPRPGDVDRVRRLGIGRWLDYQLDPQRIPDPIQDSVRARYTEAFETPADLFRAYPPPQAVRRAGGQAGSTPDTMMVAQQQLRVRRAGGAI